MRIAVAFTAALFLAACSSDSDPRLVTPSSTPAALAATIAIASGNEQEGKAGERGPSRWSSMPRPPAAAAFAMRPYRSRSSATAA